MKGYKKVFQIPTKDMFRNTLSLIATQRNFLLKNYFSFFIFLIIPLSFLTNSLDPQLSIQLTISAAILIISFILLKQEEISTLTILLFLFFIIHLAYSYKSINLGEGLFFSARTLTFTLLFYVISTTKKQLNLFLICKLFVIFSFSGQLIGLIQIGHTFLTLDSITHNSTYSFTSVYGHRNLFAEISLLTIPFNVILISKHRQLFWKITLLLSLLFCIILLSRTVWIGLLICSVIYAFYYVNIIKNRLFLIFFPVLILTLLTFYLYNQELISGLTSASFDFSNPTNSSVAERIDLWKKTLTLTQKKMWGAGLSNWKIDILSFDSSHTRNEDGLMFPQRPHNDFLHLLYELGPLGILTYAIILAYSFILHFKKHQKTKSKNLIHFNFMMLLLIWIIISLFAFPMERFGHLIFLALTLAYTPTKPIKTLNFGFNKIALALSTVLLMFFINKMKNEKILFEIKNYTSSSIIAHNKLITSINTFYTPLDNSSTSPYYYAGTMIYQLKKYNKALQLFLKAAQNNPNHIHTLNDIANCYLKLKDTKNAFVYYEKALSLNKRYIDGYYNYIIACNQTNNQILKQSVINRIPKDLLNTSKLKLAIYEN